MNFSTSVSIAASLLIAGLVAGFLAPASANAILCGISAAGVLALLFRFRFFYEVPAANKGERLFALVVLFVMIAGLLTAFMATMSIMAGIFFGVIIPPLVRGLFQPKA